MRVTVERMGGLSGETAMVAQYETAHLPEPDAARVVAAVDSLAAAHARGEAEEIGADLPAYRITVDWPGDAAPRVFEFRGDPSTGPLEALLHGSG